ncbi:hypothetical protein NMY22_g4198 [Coprinellus aureogranulatus]|nr:hypothetical protein NMY22_g4198 [Coprinellus aureogranulatus]
MQDSWSSPPLCVPSAFRDRHPTSEGLPEPTSPPSSALPRRSTVRARQTSLDGSPTQHTTLTLAFGPVFQWREGFVNSTVLHAPSLPSLSSYYTVPLSSPRSPPLLFWSFTSD